MANRPPKKADYKTQKAYWYEKLKKDGFVDIEHDEWSLRSYSTEFNQRNPNRNPTVQIAAKLDYYIMAEHFLNDYKFSSAKERAVWEYHTNGVQLNDIVKTLKEVKLKTSRTAVWLIIRKFRAIMLRMYKVRTNGNV